MISILESMISCEFYTNNWAELICMGLPWALACEESACNVGSKVRSLGQEDTLEEGMAIHSSILAMDRGAWGATVRGVSKSWTGLSN